MAQVMSVWVVVGVVRLHDEATTRVRVRDDRGSVSLEQVIVAVGLVLLAGVLVAAITAAVNRRIPALG